ncbi:choice-of-anchor P family protein [Amycolatopsis rhabdoformis]|uniref:Choice-of-anchor P family protein n=1 Tax=Amycolatopsis rhabdoformis TaxID=1448059 RepID=A0ABZ1I6C4_9PSEU|nr:choice-of-anchor P family protein [Amycolatopsis rhabdoformis]WSE29185.1 choice-of-anchor P family protein [Amycolatopsis rhabdoformis]
MLAAVVASIALAGAVPASAAPGDGSAYGANVNVKLLGANAVQAGPLSPSNTDGPTSAALASITVPGILATGAVTSSAMRDDNSGAVTAKASVAGVGLPLLGAALGKVNVGVIQAVCTATQAGVTGSATLADANLGSLGKINANPAPNTQLQVALGPVNVATLILNEQVKNPDGSLTVNALHLKLLGGVIGALGSGDVILASAKCGPAAPPMPLASGAGMWVGFGVLAAIAVPVGLRFSRRRSVA